MALVGLDGSQITGGHGITVMTDITLDKLDREQVELLVLPGGLTGVESIQGNQRALALIQYCFDQGCWLAAICAAPTILANLGILDRRSAVCYPGMEDLMGSAVVEPGQQVVVDGHIITAEGPGSAFVFGLKLVETLRGLTVAQEVRNAVHYHG